MLLVDNFFITISIKSSCMQKYCSFTMSKPGCFWLHNIVQDRKIVELHSDDDTKKVVVHVIM